jgi:Protein of unknown function (DUF4038)
VTRIVVSAGRNHLERDRRPWFYLADTIWSAFTHVPLDEWVSYLDLRRRQGFNSLQISVLPILHDLSESPHIAAPFEGFWEGSPKFGPLAGRYLEGAIERLEAAASAGFTPALVDLWCNYVPETWASKGAPSYVMPEAALSDYLASVIEAFERFKPIHIVSGDADFDSSQSIDFYAEALRTVRRLAPDALTAMHLQPEAILPDRIADADALDLYVYQSGHHVELDRLSYELAEKYLARPIRRPVLNIEPCYEGHGYGFRRGRFDQAQVRRAIWQSLVAGASAGVAYGAHGVWQWHREGTRFNHAEFSGVPFDRWDALRFPGAWDASFARRIVELYGLHELRPCQHLLLQAGPETRAASTNLGAIVIYSPYAAEIHMNLPSHPIDVAAWDLAERRAWTPNTSLRDGHVVFVLPDHLSDQLLIVWPASPVEGTRP